jgi:hypothetical protein
MGTQRVIQENKISIYLHCSFQFSITIKKISPTFTPKPRWFHLIKSQEDAEAISSTKYLKNDFIPKKRTFPIHSLTYGA